MRARDTLGMEKSCEIKKAKKMGETEREERERACVCQFINGLPFCSKCTHQTRSAPTLMTAVAALACFDAREAHMGAGCAGVDAGKRRLLLGAHGPHEFTAATLQLVGFACVLVSYTAATILTASG